MLSDRLKKARLESGLTQQQVADLLKVERSCYTYYETGKSKVSSEMLNALSVIFGTELYILTDEDEPGPTLHDDSALKPFSLEDSPINMSNITPEERRILAQIRLINMLGKREELDRCLDEITGDMFRSKYTGDYDDEL